MTMGLKKETKKESKFIPDPEMIQILQGSIDSLTVIVSRAKEYLRLEEKKMERAVKRLEDYKNGKLYK